MTTLLPVVRLIAGLAAAKDAAQVDALIAEWAAPSTTWEARRKGILFTISGRFGLGASLESLTRGQSKGGLALGLAVPVGVDVSFPVAAHSCSRPRSTWSRRCAPSRARPRPSCVEGWR